MFVMSDLIPFVMSTPTTPDRFLRGKSHVRLFLFYPPSLPCPSRAGFGGFEGGGECCEGGYSRLARDLGTPPTTPGANTGRQGRVVERGTYWMAMRTSWPRGWDFGGLGWDGMGG